MRARSQSRGRILLADDDVDFRRTLASALRMDGFDVVELPSGVGVSVFLDECAFRDDIAPHVDALVTDLRMPDVNGLMLLQQLAGMQQALPAVMITAFDDGEVRRAASELGAVAFLSKPFELSQLEDIIDRVTKG